MNILHVLIELGLLIVAAIALGVAAGFVSSAATKITKTKDWRKDHDLKKAHTYLSWSAAVGWIGLALIVLLVVLYMVFGLETAEEFGGWVVKFFLFLTLVVLLTTGSLAAIGASYINKSPNRDAARATGSYRDAIIATVLAIIAGVLIGGLFLYVMFHKPKSKAEKEKEQKDKEVKKLKDSLIEEKEAEIEERTLQAKSKSKKLK